MDFQDCPGVSTPQTQCLPRKDGIKLYDEMETVHQFIHQGLLDTGLKLVSH